MMMAATAAWSQQTPPALLSCGDHPGLQVVCGVEAPEDLEVTPDGRYLVVSQYASFRRPGARTPLLLFDLRTRTHQPLAVSRQIRFRARRPAGSPSGRWAAVKAKSPARGCPIRMA